MVPVPLVGGVRMEESMKDAPMVSLAQLQPIIPSLPIRDPNDEDEVYEAPQKRARMLLEFVPEASTAC